MSSPWRSISGAMRKPIAPRTIAPMIALPITANRIVITIAFNCSIHSRRGEDAGEKCAQRPADCVDAESIKRIIVAEPGFQFRAGKKRDDPRRHADNHCTGGSDISTGRRDYDESGHRAGTKSEHTRFPTQRVLEHGPCE